MRRARHNAPSQHKMHHAMRVFFATQKAVCANNTFVVSACATPWRTRLCSRTYPLASPVGSLVGRQSLARGRQFCRRRRPTQNGRRRARELARRAHPSDNAPARPDRTKDRGWLQPRPRLRKQDLSSARTNFSHAKTESRGTAKKTRFLQSILHRENDPELSLPTQHASVGFGRFLQRIGFDHGTHAA